MRALVISLALLAGCGSLDVPAQYRPLETMREGNPFGATAATTVGSTVYVQDLDDWRDRLETPRVRALLLHERVHAERQFERGTARWIWAYLTSREFAWREEQLGWYVQIQELRRGGETVSPEGIAKLLVSYRHPAGELVSYEEALAWVQDVLAGRWSPGVR